MKSITLEEGLDAAYSILKEQKAMLVLDLCREIVERGLLNINEKTDKGMDFTGTWHIYEMEAWDEDYFNMEVQI
jgi:hypothetical protein